MSNIDAGGSVFRMALQDGITNRLGAIEKRITKVGDRFKSIGSSIGNVGKSVTGFGAKVTAVSGVIGGIGLASAKAFASFGDDIGKMSKRTGVAVDALGGLGFAAEQSGSSLQGLERGLFGLSRATFDLQRGSGEAVDAFAKIGLSMDDLEGLSVEQQFMKVADGLKGIEDASVKGAVAQKIFGRAGRELLPMLSEGSVGMRKLKDEAADLGLVFGNADIAEAEALTDSINRFQRSVKAIGLRFGAALAGPLGEYLDSLAKGAARIGQFVDQNREMIATIGKAVAVALAVGGAITGIGIAIIGVGATFTAIGSIITGAVAAVSAAITGVAAIAGGMVAVFAALASPIGLLTAGLAAAGIAAVKFSGAGSVITEAFDGIGGRVMESVGRIKQAFENGGIGAAVQQISTEASLAWEIATVRIELAWARVMDFVRSVAENASAAAVGAFGAAAKAIAGSIDELGKMTSGLIDRYASIYDTIFNATGEQFDKLADKLSGTRRLGAAVEYDSKAFDDQFGESVGRLQDKLENLNVSASADDFLSKLENSLESNTDAAQRERLRQIDELKMKLEELGKNPVLIATEIPDVAGKLSEAFASVSGKFSEIFSSKAVEAGTDASAEGKSISSSNSALSSQIASFAPTFEADKDGIAKQVTATENVAERVGKVVEAVQELGANLSQITPADVATATGAAIGNLASKFSLDGLSAAFGSITAEPELNPIASPLPFDVAAIGGSVAESLRGLIVTSETPPNGAKEETMKQAVRHLETIAKKKRVFGR